MNNTIRPRRQCAVRATSARESIVHCTYEDRLLQRQVSMVFLYRMAVQEDVLLEGLVRALEHFPIYAGRLRSAGDELQIVCNNAGASFSSIDLDLTLEQAFAAIARGPVPWLVEMIDPARARKGRAALLTVRMCYLVDGGMALGLCFHHSLGDMRSFLLLLRAWSAAVEGRPIVAPVLIEDRPAYLAKHLPQESTAPPGFRVFSRSELSRLRHYRALAAQHSSAISVYFSPSELQRMWEAFSAEIQTRLSTNDVLCAHLVSILEALEPVPHRHDVVMAVDIRRYYDLSPSLLGNLAGVLRIRCSPGEPASRLAERIRDAVDHFAERHMNFPANARFADGLSPATRQRLDIGFWSPLEQSFSISSWSRSGVYEVRFGGQAPAYASSAFRQVAMPWSGTLVDGFDNEGILLGYWLPTPLAERLASDEGRDLLHRFRSSGEPPPALAHGVPTIL